MSIKYLCIRTARIYYITQPFDGLKLQTAKFAEFNKSPLSITFQAFINNPHEICVQFFYFINEIKLENYCKPFYTTAKELFKNLLSRLKFCFLLENQNPSFPFSLAQ